MFAVGGNSFGGPHHGLTARFSQASQKNHSVLTVLFDCPNTLLCEIVEVRFRVRSLSDLSPQRDPSWCLSLTSVDFCPDCGSNNRPIRPRLRKIRFHAWLRAELPRDR